VTGADEPRPPESPAPPLVLVRGEATEEEVAALLAVLQGLSAATPTAEEQAATRSEWAAGHRRLRATYPAGPGGWRSSGLPR
jgi:hypothetical protein